MERDGTGQLSTIYTYGNQRISTESYNNLSGLYTYDGRGSVSAVIGSYGDFRASYWYDGLGNVKSQIHGYGAFGSGKKYYGYNAESYNPVTGNQNLRARQVNIRRQRFLTEDTYLGQLTDVLSINRYAYAESNPLRYKDSSGNSIYESIGKATGLTDSNAIGCTVYSLDGPLNIVADALSFTHLVQFFGDNPITNTLSTGAFMLETAVGLDKLIAFKTVLDKNGNLIITTNYDNPQGLAGYVKTYDSIFHKFTSSDHDKIKIGKDYTIWTWKGDYLNLGAGGEIGIYKGTGDLVKTTMSDHLGVSMSMEVLAEYKNSKDWSYTLNPSEAKPIQVEKSLVNYSPEGESWWLTGWNPLEQGYKYNDLTLKGTLDFSANDETRRMYNDLKASYNEQKRSGGIKGNMSFSDNNDYIVNYIW